MSHRVSGKIALFLLLFLLRPVYAEVIEGEVFSIADGDTIDLMASEQKLLRIRLSGIDAPEIGQPYGHISKVHLESLIVGKRVRVEYEKHDRFGRIVGRIISNGVDLNLEQLKMGMAWHFKKYQHEQPLEERQAYEAAEIVAREKEVGLWRDPNATPPWVYREQRRAGNLPSSAPRLKESAN